VNEVEGAYTPEKVLHRCFDVLSWCKDVTVDTGKSTARYVWFVSRFISGMAFISFWFWTSYAWFGKLPGRWSSFIEIYSFLWNSEVAKTDSEYWLAAFVFGTTCGLVVLTICTWLFIGYKMIMYIWRKLLDSYYRWCMVDLATVCDVEVGLTYDEKGPKVDFPINGKLYRARVPLFNQSIKDKAVGMFVKESKFADSDISVVNAPACVAYCVKNGVIFGELFRVDIGGEDCLATAWHVWKDLDNATIVKPGESRGLNADDLPVPFAYASVDENGDGLDFVIMKTDVRFASTVGLKKAKLAIDLGSTCRTYGPVPEVCGSANGHISDVHDFPYLYYTASTLPSWSGGPVFDANGHIVAMHLGGGTQSVGLNRGIWMGTIKSLIRERRYPASFTVESKLERKRRKYNQKLERQFLRRQEREEQEYDDDVEDDRYVYVAGERHEVSQEYLDHMRTTRMRKVNYSNLGKQLAVTIDDQVALVEAMEDGDYYVVPFEEMPPEQQRELIMENKRREEMRIKLAERQLEEAKRRRRIVKDVKPAPVPVKSAWNTQFKKESKEQMYTPENLLRELSSDEVDDCFDEFFDECGPCGSEISEVEPCESSEEEYPVDVRVAKVIEVLENPEWCSDEKVARSYEIVRSLEYGTFTPESKETGTQETEVEIAMRKLEEVKELFAECDFSYRNLAINPNNDTISAPTFVQIPNYPAPTLSMLDDVQEMDNRPKPKVVTPSNSPSELNATKKKKKKRKKKPKVEFKPESIEPQLTFVQAPKEEAATTPSVAANQENGQPVTSSVMAATAHVSKPSNPQGLPKVLQLSENVPESKDSGKNQGTMVQLLKPVPQYKVSTGMFGPLNEQEPSLPVSATNSAGDKIFRVKLIERRERLNGRLMDLVSQTDQEPTKLAKRTLEIKQICEQLSRLGEQLATLGKVS
jgi:hypothetical protein